MEQPRRSMAAAASPPCAHGDGVQPLSAAASPFEDRAATDALPFGDAQRPLMLPLVGTEQPPLLPLTGTERGHRFFSRGDRAQPLLLLLAGT